ncbi:hypothetical protein [Pelomonas sp. KK5]|uniref:hypothetical protein n=1 Tax=Pelomonas sp. KK5 TaxID=1855730 RepID=UPI001301AED4|nr:hypothetical protein [Pelomonas sp. KK5]
MTGKDRRIEHDGDVRFPTEDTQGIRERLFGEIQIEAGGRPCLRLWRGPGN